jgi:hypothetical protein
MKEYVMLSHGQHITKKEIESITSSWSPDEFASLCNSVVWASARSQGTILPSFTERVNVKDKGIDAEYLWLDSVAGSASHLVSAGWTVLQYKLRDVSAQNRAKIVTGLKNELKKTNSDKEDEGALKDVYVRTERRPARYVLFTNIDLSHAQKDALKATILKGYDQPETVEVVVNGAADIAALLNDLPHLRSAYFVPSRFSSWEQAWIAHTKEKLVRSPVELIGRGNELARLKSYLDDPVIQAVILAGPTNIGKSRLAIEATRHCQTDTIVALDPTSMGVSDLLAAVSPHTGTIMLIEDPDPKKAEEFVRHVLGHSGLKLVLTLPTAEQAPTPNFGQDERVQTIRVEPLSDLQSRELLKAADAKFDFGVESWIISQAGGNPGVLIVAASVPDLRKTTNPFAYDVATTFKRKIQQELGDRAVEVLCLISLLTRIDIRGPKYDELTSISSAFGRDLQLNDMLNEIPRLEYAGVVRVRGGYVEVVPSLLANHLTTSTLKGRYAELAALFVAMKRAARFRFIERLREVKSDEVTHFWDELFSSTGLFADFQSALSHLPLLLSISGAASNHVARLFEEGLGALSVEELRSIAWNIRRSLMSILIELLFRSSTSKVALRCLLLLAETEVGMTSNSSSETFYDCFHPFQPQCPLPLEDRVDILRWATSTESSFELRSVGLQAIIRALSAGLSFGLHEGNGPEPLATLPVMTYSDLWNYWEALLDMLIAIAQTNQPTLAELARSALPRVLTQYTLFGHLTGGLARFRQVAQWCVTKELPLSVSDLSGSLLHVQNAINHQHTENIETQERIQHAHQEILSILNYLEESDFSTRLKRWAGTWANDEHVEELRLLAIEVINQPQLLTDSLLMWLTSNEAKLGWTFFQMLGEQDTEHYWLPQIEQVGATNDGSIAVSMYLTGLSKFDQSFVSRQLDKLADEDKVTGEAIISAMGYFSGDKAGVERVEKLLGKRRVNVGSIELRLLRSNIWINTLTVEEYLRFLKAIAGNELEHAKVAVNSLNMWLYGHTNIDGAIAEFAWKCLEKTTPDSFEDTHRCDVVASKLAETDVERGFALLEHILKQQHTSMFWNPLSPYTGGKFWSALRKADQRRALSIPLSIASNDTSVRLSVIQDLLSVIDQEKDAGTLLRFADEEREQAKVVCKSLAAWKPGFWPIARQIFLRYSDDQDMKDLLQIAIMRKNIPMSVMSGLPSLDLQSRLDDIQRVLVDVSLSFVERSWLKQIESTLRSEMENYRQYESGMRTSGIVDIEDDPKAPERIWMLQQQLRNGQLNSLRKTITREEMLLLLPNLQLTEEARAKIEIQVKRWE